MPLHIDHRPESLEEIYGNTPIVNALKGIFSNEESMSHVFLFTGRPGCGKTTFAYVIRNLLGVSKTDFHIYDTANTRGIDTIRDLIANLKNSPLNGKRKLYLLDECAQITPEGLNALLKTLEDGCPKHCFFVLCTSEFDSIRKELGAALRRRCSDFEVKPLILMEIKEFLTKILDKEGFSEYPETITNKIINLSEGSPGHALSILDTIINITDEEEALAVIDYKVYGNKEVMDICRILVDPLDIAKWIKIKKIIPSIKKNDVESLRYGMLNYLEKVLLTTSNEHIADIMTLFTDSFMYIGRPGITLACYLACRKKDDDDIPF